MDRQDLTYCYSCYLHMTYYDLEALDTVDGPIHNNGVPSENGKLLLCVKMSEAINRREQI